MENEKKYEVMYVASGWSELDIANARIRMLEDNVKALEEDNAGLKMLLESSVAAYLSMQKERNDLETKIERLKLALNGI